MWKWLLVLLLLIVLIAPLPVLADTSANVVVTATGWICEVPGGLTLTYITDYEVGISWIKGAGAENTMVRAAYGRMPSSRTDGYLVYYGDGTFTSDTGVNFEEGVSDVHYRAWSQNVTGIWEEIGASDFMENPYMLLIVLAGLAFGFTIASVILKKGSLSFAGASVWIITSIYCFTKYTVTWDTYFSLGFLFLFLTLVEAFSPLAWREKPDDDDESPDMRNMREEMESWNKERQQWNFLYSNKPKKKGKTRYQRT